MKWDFTLNPALIVTACILAGTFIRCITLLQKDVKAIGDRVIEHADQEEKNFAALRARDHENANSIHLVQLQIAKIEAQREMVAEIRDLINSK